MHYKDGVVVAGQLLPMFEACMPVMRCDIQSSRFLLPYLLQNVISYGSQEAISGKSYLGQRVCRCKAYTLHDNLNVRPLMGECSAVYKSACS